MKYYLYYSLFTGCCHANQQAVSGLILYLMITIVRPLLGA